MGIWAYGSGYGNMGIWLPAPQAVVRMLPASRPGLVEVEDSKIFDYQCEYIQKRVHVCYIKNKRKCAI